ncbi:MAG TPA: ABC transporter permease subunit [Candidatus Limnocylindrales bacterium]|nr:ABC transporter permease subunit [Candidatus Limnocylindrales bacterium]
MTNVGIGFRAPGALDALQGAAQDRPRRVRFGRIWPWIVFIAGFLYFFLPLLGTLEFSLRARPAGAAYTNVLKDPQFSATLLYSFVIAVITIILSIAIIVPTAYWVRLRLPWLRPIVEFVTLMPFVIPPVILAFGLIRSYSGAPFHLTNLSFGSDLLLVAAYTVLSFPYMYRAVDTGLRAIDVRTLTEAAQSMGSGWGRILVQVILPNLRVSLLSGAFLTLAIVIGEYTIATFLARPAFGPYLALIGQNKAYEPAAASLISFGLTWIAMGVIALLGRGSRVRVQVAGAH